MVQVRRRHDKEKRKEETKAEILSRHWVAFRPGLSWREKEKSKKGKESTHGTWMHKM